MKTITTFLGITFWWIVCASAQTEVNSPQDPKWRLVGIVDVADYTRALVEIGKEREFRLLDKGHRAEGLEVQSIRMDRQQVVARLAGDEHAEAISGSNENQRSMTNGLSIQVMDLQKLCELYQELKGQTLLLHPKLPKLQLSIHARAHSKEDAARAIERVMEENGICTSVYLEKFVAVLPVSATNELFSVTNRITVPSSEEVVQAGMIDFRRMPMVQVFVVLGEYLGKKTDRFRSSIPYREITFRTHTPHSRADIVLAFQTLFVWNGVALSEDEDELKAVVLPPK